MNDLEQAIGYTFRDKELLNRALTHTSYANEKWQDSLKSYERLEFLGDSILGFVTADYLFAAFPKLPEGSLTKLRADLVCEKSLAVSAKALNIGSYLRLGHGEETSGGRNRASIIADVMESVIAAIYLDGGFSPAKEFIYRHVLVDTKQRVQASTDYKTLLQELVQRKRDQVLSYHLLSESGPDHDKHFEVAVDLNGAQVGTGVGTSKKRAEQMAAQQAIHQLFPGEL